MAPLRVENGAGVFVCRYAREVLWGRIDLIDIGLCCFNNGFQGAEFGKIEDRLRASSSVHTSPRYAPVGT